MIRKNRIFSVMVLVSFTFNIAISDMAFGQVSGADNSTLATATGFGPDAPRTTQDLAGGVEPGAIGNGPALANLAKGILPARVETQDADIYRKIDEAISTAITMGLQAKLGNKFSDDDHKYLLDRTIDNLIALRSAPQKNIWLFNAVIDAREDYLLGFSFAGQTGLSIELVDILYGINPMRLAQYIFHECAPENEISVKDGSDPRAAHRAMYTEIQTGVFGEGEVIALRRNLRNYITAVLKERSAPEPHNILTEPLSALSMPEPVAKVVTDRRPSIEELNAVSLILQRDIIRMIKEGKSQSGHPGGSLSTVDILTALYFDGGLRVDPDNGQWANRDILALSKGHAAPALYAALARRGFFPTDEYANFRTLGGLQGHPDATMTNGVDVSTGSLGLGISVASGTAIAAKMDDRDYLSVAICGDGELQEGQVSEAAKRAAAAGLDNFLVFVDCNGEEIDGKISMVDITDQAMAWKSYGFNVITIDGHNMAEIRAAIDIARQTKGRPTVVLANTVKGRNLPGMRKHGGVPGDDDADKSYAVIADELAKLGINNDEEAERFLRDIREKIELGEDDIRKIDEANDARARARTAELEKIAAGAKGNVVDPKSYENKDKMATRVANGNALYAIASEDTDLVTLCGDLSGSICLEPIGKDFGIWGTRGENIEGVNEAVTGRHFEAGISEGNMASVAAGLAMKGKIPVVATYAMFLGRLIDQVTAILKPNLPMIVLAAHDGMATGDDGQSHANTHMGAVFAQLPKNVTMYTAADAEEQDILTHEAYRKARTSGGIQYVSLARPDFPVLEKPEGWQEGVKRGFYTIYDSTEGRSADVVIVATGVIMSNAIDAAKDLTEKGNKVRVVNVTKLLEVTNKDNGGMDDFAALINGARNIVTVADALPNMLRDKVNEVIVEKKTGPEGGIKHLGVQGFAETGTPDQLYKKHGLDAAGIASSSLELIERGSAATADTIASQAAISETEAAMQELIHDLLPYRARAFAVNLSTLLKSSPDRKFLLAIDDDLGTGNAQNAQVFSVICDVVKKMESLTDANGQKVFPNLLVERDSAISLKNKIMERVWPSDSNEKGVRLEDVLLVTSRTNLNSVIGFKEMAEKKEVWITAIDDSREGAYLPIFEAATLSIMAYLNNLDNTVELGAIQKYFNSIADNPVTPDVIEDMIKNRTIIIVPKATQYDLKQLRAIYDAALEAYTAA